MKIIITNCTEYNSAYLLIVCVSPNFASTAPPPWHTAFSQFAPVVNSVVSVLAAGSNCAVKPTRLRRAAYFRSLEIIFQGGGKMAIPIIIEGKPIAKWSRLSGNRNLKKSSIQQLVRHIGLPLVMTANPINIAVNPIMKPPFLLICRLTNESKPPAEGRSA